MDEHVHHGVLVGQVDHQAQGLAMAAAARQLVAAEGVETAVGGEYHQLFRGLSVQHEAAAVPFLVFHFRGIDDVAFDGAGPAHLRTEHGDGLALDHGFQRHHDGRRRLADLGPAAAQFGAGAEPFLDLADLVADHPPAMLLVGEEVLDLRLFRRQRRVLLFDRLLLQLAQLAQAHVQDGVGLHLAQVEGAHELALGLVVVADDADDLVQVQIGDQQSAEDFQPPLDVAQAVVAAAHKDLVAVIEERGEDLAQGHHPGRVGCIQHVHVEADAHLQVGLPEKLLHQHFGLHRAVFRLEHQAHPGRAFVPHVGQQGKFPRRQKLGDFLDQPGLLHLIGNLRDHHLVLAAAGLLDFPSGPQAHAAAPGAVGVYDIRPCFHQHAAGGEVRTGDQVHQLGDGGLGEFDQVDQGGAQFAHVVGWNVGRHAHRDARRPVGQQVGKAGRQHHRFVVFAVIGAAEIDGVLVDAFQKRPGDVGQPRLRVAHGRRVVAVDAAEVALPVHQRIAHRELLGQAHKGIVDGGIPVGVVLANDVADHAGALLEPGRRVQLELAHGEQEPPVHGLQAVAHVGKGARHDGGQGVRQIPLAKGVDEGGVADVSGRGGFAHGGPWSVNA